ncbi:MAG: extracellular solute-binding protein, partial [Oscillospiraceae bacterium]|nr:extracellular solute-binding protein [Oscillospiraceae bacterium]
EASSGARPKISVAVMDFGNFPADRGTIENNDITEWINDNSPVEIEFISINRSEVTALYTAMLSAGNAPDIINDYAVEAFERFVIDESLLELTDLIDEHGPNIRALVPQDVLDWGMHEGGLYALPKTRNETAVPNWMQFIRQDWLDNLGLDMPNNFDELYDVMYAFTFNDPDGNGEDDTYGYGAGSGESEGGGPGFGGIERILCLYGAMRDRWLPYGPDGSYDYVGITENRREGYRYAKRLFDDGLVNPEFFTMTGQQARTEFITGKVGTLGMQVGSVSVTMLAAMKEIDPNANPRALKTLESPFGTFAYLHERSAQMHIMIPTTCSDPVAAIQYLDWQVGGAWEYITYGEEGVYFERVNGRIIRIGDPEERSHALNHAGNYCIAIGYRELISDLELQLEHNKDNMSDLEIQALETHIEASQESMSHEFKWWLPTLHLGLEMSNDLIPQMGPFSTRTFEEAVINKDMSIDDAYDRIIKEFDALGYQELRQVYNDRIIELGLG